DPSAAVSDYQASIAWGDGSSSTGTISTDPSGGYDVSGSHSYTDEGMNAITVTIQDATTSTSAIANATVVDTSLTASGVSIAAGEGATSSTTVAHFTDANPLSAANDFTAIVNWGDGSASTTGTVTTNPNGGFDVSGASSYGEEGAYAVSVAVTDAGGASVTVASTANVTDAALTATFKPISASEGTAVSGVVATVNDADPAGTSADYSATITWGDGITTVATIAADPNGGFD